MRLFTSAYVDLSSFAVHALYHGHRPVTITVSVLFVLEQSITTLATGSSIYFGIVNARSCTVVTGFVLAMPCWYVIVSGMIEAVKLTSLG